MSIRTILANRAHNIALVKSGEVVPGLIVEEVGPDMLPTAGPGDDGSGWVKVGGVYQRPVNPKNAERHAAAIEADRLAHIKKLMNSYGNG